jgi:hypothetical protein
VFLDTDFPKILGAELYRPHPAYICEMAVEPVVVHDFTSQPGQTVQLDRYKFWGNPGTKDSRERISDQTIGTANSRNITKEKVLVVLKEYTGPADPGDPTQPSTFKIARETLITAQRMLLDTGNLNMFHQSIGSLTLLDDYRRWRDRVFLDELAKAEANGPASSSQGGYYFPGNKTKNPSYTTTEYAAQVQQFQVRTDLLTVVKDLRKRNVPTFADGLYRCICDPTFMMHLRRDPDFREIARYSGSPGQGMYMGNPMMPNNTSFFQGPQAGQGYFLAGEPVDADRRAVRRRQVLRVYKLPPPRHSKLPLAVAVILVLVLMKLLKASSSVLKLWAWVSVVRTRRCLSTTMTTSAVLSS